MSGKPKIIAIVGPTAVGKTGVSIPLARRLSAEIISCDSMQVYKGMDIGTAKASPEKRLQVPHHLIDVVDPDQNFSVALFKEKAEEAIEEIRGRQNLPMLVGGTGLYLRAVLQDYPILNVPPDWDFRDDMRRRAEREGRHILHEELQEIDPEAADRIHPNDLKRVIRALEVYEQTGKTITTVQRETPDESPFDYLKVGLRMDRDVLYERINRRVDRMLEEGLVEETEKLRKEYDLADTAKQALGYEEIISYLEGECCLKEAVRLIKRNTRHFAKRQLTWFTRDEEIHWFERDPRGKVSGLISDILQLIAGKWPQL